MERIVVGIDGSETSRAALRWAMDEARQRKAAVEVVHAWHQPFAGGYAYMGEIDLSTFEEDARRVLDAAVDEVDTTGVPSVEPILVADPPTQALLDAAKGASLLVVGTRGRGGFAGLLLGSVGQQVVHHAACPVVVVPPGL
jgi:nucleotide-binding universal stress UspA family protein